LVFNPIPIPYVVVVIDVEPILERRVNEAHHIADQMEERVLVDRLRAIGAAMESKPGGTKPPCLPTQGYSAAMWNSSRAFS
jgi:hypothetical protein